jgi:hypothetical protein
MTVKLNEEYEILTPSGWKNFVGISKTQNKKERIEITFDDNSSVIASPDHPFFIKNNKILVSQLKIGDKLDHHTSSKTIKTINELEKEYLYDIIEVSDEEHKFLINDSLITKNCDELGFLRPSIQSDFWAAIRPTLSSSKGDSILTSTPGNDDDLFANIWRGANDTVLPTGEELEVGKNGYKATFADWRDHPDRDEQWAIDERAAMGEERFLREHENRFINFNTTLIDSMVLERLSPLNHKFTMGEVRWFKAPSPGHSYFVMLDPSLGTKSDWSAIQIIEMPTLEHIGEWSSNTTPPKGQVQILHDILNYIADEIDPYGDDPDIYWSFENNTIGEAILQTIEETGIEYFPGNLVSEKKLPSMKRRFRKGLNTTNKNKLLACSKFKSLVDTERLKPASVGVIKQLKNFTANGASFSAKGSGNDDLVMALILAVRLVEMTKNWEIYDPEILSDSIEHDFREPLPIVFS